MKRPTSFTFIVKILAVVMIATTLLAAFPILNVSAANLIITLDPGHGAHDPGNPSAKAFGGQDESYDNYWISYHTKARLEQYAGVTVYMTRGENEFKELAERVQIAKNYNSDAIVSIHTNSATATANGVEIWVPNDNYRADIAAASKNCANTVLGKYIAATGLRNRGLKTKNGSSTFPDDSAADSLSILRNGKIQGIPVVMLIETAFASNQGDYQKVLSSDAARQRAGYAIADGLAAYYGLSPKGGASLPGVDVPVVPTAPSYYSCVDHINGYGPNNTANFTNVNGSNSGGAATVDAVASGVQATTDGKMSIGGWMGVDGGTSHYVYSVDNGATWKKATGGYDGEPVDNLYSGSFGYTNATKMGMFNKSVSPLIADLTAYVGQTVTVTFAAVPLSNTTIQLPFLKVTNYTVPTVTTPSTSTAKYWSSVDHVNGKGPNGSANFAGIGGNGEGTSVNTIDAVAMGVTVNADCTMTIGGWMGLDNGTDHYVYSIDGGATWEKATGGYDGEPQNGYYATKYGMTNATKMGLFKNSKSPLVADLSEYAGQTLTVTFAAVSAVDSSVIIPFVTISNYTVPEKATETDSAETRPSETEPVEPQPDDTPDVESANGLVIDVAGHELAQDFSAGGYDAWVIKFTTYGKAANLGELDLSKYEKVIITYGSDKGAMLGDLGGTVYLTSTGAIADKKNNPIDYTELASATLSNPEGNWAAGSRTVEISLADVNYNGPVYLTYNVPEKQGMVVSAITFVASAAEEDTSAPADEDTSVEPEDTTVEPEDTTVEHENTTVESEDTTVEPEVTQPSVDDPEDTESEATQPNNEEEVTIPRPTPNPPKEKEGCKSTVLGALAMVALTTVAAVCLVRKKED